MATTDLGSADRALRASCPGLALSALLGLALPALAQQQPSEQQLLSPQQVEEQVSQRLGVRVLGIETIEADGGTRYAVKVMNPPGNDNAALLVTTLVVDAATGEILGEAAPDSGLTRPALPSSEPESGLEARRRTYR